MSGPSTYNPKSGIAKWIDSRLPLPRLMHDTISTFPTPRNLNIWYIFGGILTFCLAVQIVTGIVLAMHYVASTNLAFNSVEAIMRDVNYGWLIRYVHANGASMFFLAVYIHMFRGLYYGSYKAPRELIWIIGVLIYLLMTATAFFGYVLPWGQMSFWGATVITNMFSAVPVVGQAIATWLWGDFAVGEATLNRFFSLHYLLPFYAMLRAVPDKLLGVIVMVGAIITLVFIPWLDTSRVRSCRFRPLMKQFFWAFAIVCVILGYCGAQSVEATAFGIPLVWVARIATLYYFAYFWLIMPIAGLIETPKKLPASIAQSVLGDSAAKPAE